MFDVERGDVLSSNSVSVFFRSLYLVTVTTVSECTRPFYRTLERCELGIIEKSTGNTVCVVIWSCTVGYADRHTVTSVSKY